MHVDRQEPDVVVESIQGCIREELEIPEVSPQGSIAEGIMILTPRKNGKLKPRVAELDSLEDSLTLSSEETCLQHEERHLVGASLRRLVPDQRCVIRLLWAGMTISQIAAAMGKKRTTVCGIRQRAIFNLHRLVQQRFHCH
jgi:DNA-directed RNA polymerase specialized sigma24 family protein